MCLLQLDNNAGRIPLMHSLSGVWKASIYFHATCLPLPPHTAMIKDVHLQKEPLNFDSPSFKCNAFATFAKFINNNNNDPWEYPRYHFSVSLSLSFCCNGLPLCHLVIKWFIVGCACKICKKIACFAMSISGTADTVHFATWLQWQKKTMVTFTWVVVHNPQESNFMRNLSLKSSKNL